MFGEVRRSDSSSTEREEPLFKEILGVVDDDEETALEERKEMRMEKRKRAASFEEEDGFLMFGIEIWEKRRQCLEGGDGFLNLWIESFKDKNLKKGWTLGRRRWVFHVWIEGFGVVNGILEKRKRNA